MIVTFLNSLVVPLVLLGLTTYVSTIGYALLAYVIIFTVSDRARRLGRAGFLPWRSESSRPVVLGGGWSWVLQRRLLPPNTLVCASGKKAGTSNWWHSGTTIRELQRHFGREGKTLAGHPSILSATLGGWIASHSHGTGGSLWTPTTGRVVVDDPVSGRTTLPSKKYVTEQMIIREVEMFSVENVVCERRLEYIDNTTDVERTLFQTPTHLRAIFVDKYSCICITWVPCSDQSPPARCSFEFPPLWLMTLLPAALKRNMNVDARRRRMTLRDANAFGPDPPFLLVTGMIFTHTNFEVFVTETSTPRLICTICNRFKDLFASGKIRGRLEVRFGKRVQFLDFDLLGCATSYKEVFDTIRDIYGADVMMELHKGKAQVNTSSS